MTNHAMSRHSTTELHLAPNGNQYIIIYLMIHSIHCTSARNMFMRKKPSDSLMGIDLTLATHRKGTNTTGIGLHPRDHYNIHQEYTIALQMSCQSKIDPKFAVVICFRQSKTF